MSIRSAACGLLFFCLCACSAGTPSVPSNLSATPPSGGSIGTPVQPSAAIAGPTETFPSTLEPTAAPLDRPLYQIEASLDTRLSTGENGETMSLVVREQATYTNHSAESIPELVLQIEPARRKELFELQSLSSNRASQTAPASIENGLLRIPLEAPLAPGESVVIRLEYRRIIAQENSVLGWNNYQIVIGNWYASFPPYLEGKGWLAHAPGKVGEHLSFAYADFDIRLDIQGDTTYWVAASGVSEEGEMPLHFRFTGRSFALALTTQIPYRRTAGNVEIIGYTRPQYEAQGNFMTGLAARSVEIFTERYGAYPHPRLTLLESELPDGMEYDGLVFLNPELFPYYAGNGADYLTAITAHETAHQWWYGRVGNDQAIDPWLDESFATYSELFFYERAYPSLVKWWWWTRVQRYPSDLCVDYPVYQFTRFRDYVDSVYLRGATMLHALRQRMGNQPFEESLRELQSEGLGAVITAADVFRIFQSRSAVPLYNIWDEYLCMPPPHA
ncbi:MAG: M1 family aminopeptidase [Anaerolineales bacterium]